MKMLFICDIAHIGHW